MEKVLEMLRSLSYADLTAVGKELANLKRQAKEDGKEQREDARRDVALLVNGFIEDGTLTKNSKITILYKGEATICEVVTVPTGKSDNLKVFSEHFETKDNVRYAPKHTFLGMVD